MFKGILAALALAAAARLIHGEGAPGYDALFSLIWSRELLDGMLPQVEEAIAPTPHPGGLALTTLAAPFGNTGARDLVVVGGYIALGAASLAVAREAQELAGLAAAVLAGGLVLLAPEIGVAAREGLVDVPFVAAVAWAVVLAMRDESAVRGPLLLLAVAGVMRPEAWLLSAGLLLWRGRRDPVAWLIAISSPLIWLGMDVWLTGDPFYSSGSTHLEGRPTGLDAAIEAAPAGARELIGLLPVAAGLAGAVASVRFRPALAPVAVGAPLLALVAYLAIGLAGQPVIQRYTLLLAVLLAPLAALAAFGWTVLRADDPARRWWGPLGLVLAVALAVTAIAGAGDRTALDDRLPVEHDLERLLEEELFAEIAACASLRFQNADPTPLARWVLDLPSETVSTLAEGPDGVIVEANGGRTWVLDPRSISSVPEPATPVAEQLEATQFWVARRSGC